MKYLGQRDKHSCVPIAFLNAFKWMGINTSAKHLKSLKEILGTDPRLGTGRRSQLKLARDAGFTRVLKPTIAKMDRELLAGNALLVDFRLQRRQGGHICLITRRTRHHFICVNLFNNETVSRVTKKRFEKQFFTDPVVHRVKPLEIGNLVFYAAKAA